MKFLDIQGGKSRSEILWRAEAKYNLNLQTPCPYIHPGIGCVEHAIVFWILGLFRALPVYLPLHLVSLFLSKKKSGIVFLVGLLRSCAFLSSLCTLSWAAACFFLKNIRPGIFRSNLLMFCWFPGFSLLIESPHRRGEIAWYCLTHAINSLFSFASVNNYFTVTPKLSAIVLASTFAYMLSDSSKFPVFISKYLFGIKHSK